MRGFDLEHLTSTLAIPCSKSEAKHLWLAGQTQEVPLRQLRNKYVKDEIQI